MPLASLLIGSPSTPSWSGAAGALFPAALTTALLYGYGQWSYSIPSLRRLAPQILKALKSVVAVAFDRGGRRLHVRSAHRVARANLGMDGIERHSAVQRSLCSDARHRPADIGRPARAADRDRWRRQDANDLIRELRADPANHMQILSVFDDRQDERVGMSKTSVAQLGTFEKLAGFCSDMCVDLLIVTVPVRAEERLMQILEKLFTLQADIRVSALNSSAPQLASLQLHRSRSDACRDGQAAERLGSHTQEYRRPDYRRASVGSRFSGYGAHRHCNNLDSNGPVFFRQKRYGFNNELIDVYKFRSMYVDRQDAMASKLVPG
jgi:CoA-binding domain/Bacterial sugar transferase